MINLLVEVVEATTISFSPALPHSTLPLQSFLLILSSCHVSWEVEILSVFFFWVEMKSWIFLARETLKVLLFFSWVS